MNILCCLDLNGSTAAEQVFSKLKKFMKEKQIGYYGKSLFSNYRRGSCNDWTLFGNSFCVKAVAINCVLKHYIIHREAPAVKPLSSEKQRKNGNRKCYGYSCENCELH